MVNEVPPECSTRGLLHAPDRRTKQERKGGYVTPSGGRRGPMILKEHFKPGPGQGPVAVDVAKAREAAHEQASGENNVLKDGPQHELWYVPG